MKKQTLLRIAVVSAAIAFFAYTQLKPKPDHAQAQLAAPIPVNAEEFTLGALQFKSCELAQKNSGATTSAYCAPFSVPENPDKPDGRKLALRLALIKSDAVTANRDIVVYLAGGPGQSAVDTYPQMASALAPLRKHHHILVLDQRGTGKSHSLVCKSDEDADDADKLDLDKLRAHVATCLAEVEKTADPRYYTTTIATHDVEAVRQALGSPQFDLVGVSYGTRVAQQYAMHFPKSVRSIVLDSVVPNELVLGETFAINLENALKAQFDLCKQTPACTKAFGDPYASLYKLRDRLRAQPQDYTYPDPVTFQARHKHLNAYTLAGLVRMFAYSPETAALLPLSIAQGLKGDFTPLAGQTQILSGDLSDLQENGMQISVICSEDADLIKPHPQDADTILGTSMSDAIKAECEIWPHGTRPKDFHEPIKTATPVLILEGELDPVTPPAYGKQVLKGLSNGRLLIAKGQGHNVIGRGCMPKLVEEFVDDLKPKTLDAKCADALGPLPAFIDFNGAAP
ncbi:MAG TPA: alpha/beta hydrolase [Rudaea sp.]|nr:alpha/beta hydrolase [Rudaea sp.]